MSHNRSHDLLLLLACGMSAACGPSTEAGNADNEADVDAALTACGAWATKQTACYAEAGTSGGYSYGYGGSYLSNLGYCFLYLGYGDSVGPTCRGAIEDHFACLATLDCDELDGGDVSEPSDGTAGDPGPSERPCAMQQDAVEAACESSDGDDPDVLTTGG